MRPDLINTKKLQRLLLTWFKKNRRRLPWREDRGWYKIWISEIMLQQTRVQQVVPYFLRFIQAFPDVKKLARARQEKVLQVWEGLGYYSRARNLHLAARMIVTGFQGELPRDDGLLSRLPGFGPYTTHAVLSIAFNQPYAVVDGNVLRIASRLFKIRNDLRSSLTRKKIQKIMDMIIDRKSPGLFNEAMMELGALICLPLYPLCIQCPLQELCAAFQSHTVAKYPYKSKPVPKPSITNITFLLQNRKKFLIVKRPQRGLLAGLWEFPSYSLPLPSGGKDQKWEPLLKDRGIKAHLIRRLPAITHSYTHFNLLLIPYHLQTEQRKIKFEEYDTGKWVLWSALKKLPMHRVMRKLIAISKTESVPVSKRKIKNS